MNKKSILQKFQTAMQYSPVLINVDHTDVAAAAGLIPGACAKEMYRPACDKFIS
jgi:Fe2+ transport system protein B